MIKITSKSITLKKNKRDGLRICVMRRVRPEYEFDLWIPKLAPSERLLRDYVINRKINWEDFSERYKKSVLSKNRLLINLIIYLAKRHKVTLLCFERTAKFCHRSLILEEIKKHS
jgi:uncharacterized protein YeaO (DUF488 family)